MKYSCSEAKVCGCDGLEMRSRGKSFGMKNSKNIRSCFCQRKRWISLLISPVTSNFVLLDIFRVSFGKVMRCLPTAEVKRHHSSSGLILANSKFLEDFSPVFSGQIQRFVTLSALDFKCKQQKRKLSRTDNLCSLKEGKGNLSSKDYF